MIVTPVCHLSGSWLAGGKLATPCHLPRSLSGLLSQELSSEPQQGESHTDSAWDLKPSTWQPPSFLLPALLVVLHACSLQPRLPDFSLGPHCPLSLLPCLQKCYHSAPNPRGSLIPAVYVFSLQKTHRHLSRSHMVSFLL